MIRGEGNNVSNIEPRGTLLYLDVIESVTYLTVSQMINFGSSKLKEFADNNFIFDENGRKFSKRVEKTVGKGEIARYKQFLLLLKCFQKSGTADT